MSQMSAGISYSVGGEGVVMIALPGDDIETEGVDLNVVTWSGNLTVTEQDVTNTSDYNATTRLMNPREINTGQRLEGTFMLHHNSILAKDALKLYPVGAYYVIRLYITQGNVAVVGPPAIAANTVCYFDLTEGKFGQIAIQGGAPTEVRGLEYSFKSNGVFNYVNEVAA